ncbi:PRC-barrel domain-containing protein [Novosphingobium sp.]|uniref:PRC-barrel domain-containing protein n=1 Tax=Novosphingobium sp. TaxID=1874826 RepID=UPI00334147ED
MLWSASSIRGYTVVASDGTSGTVSDFIFEDRGWAIRWLVVETGAWFAGRRLFVPVSAFGHPDPETQAFSLDMTLAELADCPGRDLAQLSDAETGAHFTQDDMAGGQTDHAGPHFRSLAVMSQATVAADDGAVGHAEDFLIDSADWQVKYLVVDTSDWWFGEKILISTHAITGIDYMHHVLTLDVTRQFVKDGARFSPEQTVDGAFDESFETYFGIRFVKK